MAAKKGKILVVDDNTGIRQALKILLPMYFAEVQAIPSPSTLVSTLEAFRPDVILLDMNFYTEMNTGNEGLYWVGEIKKMMPEVEVVLFTAYADIQLAVEGMKRGAFDFIVKPWDNEKLVTTLTAARDKARKAMGKDSSAKGLRMTGGACHPVRMTGGACHPERSEGSMFWGTSKAMAVIQKTVQKIAPTDATVLITGENGTGKDVLAHEIHAASLRSAKPMVAVDAGAIPETLFESELFGHVKGAFTDAFTDHAGRFEQADGGTLFLDEVGNIPLHLQAKLLRALQSRSIVRVGGAQQIPVDIRLICATNMDLEALVREGRFREDLYYRINTVHIALPPLRERREDIVPLAERFMAQFADKYHRPLAGLDASAREALAACRWSGNIRELQNVMEKAVILCDPPAVQSEAKDLSAEDLQLDPSGSTLRMAPGHSERLAGRSEQFTGHSAQFTGRSEQLTGHSERSEESTIREAVQRCRGNISAAAKLLGISRPTLYAKMKKYGL